MENVEETARILAVVGVEVVKVMVVEGAKVEEVVDTRMYRSNEKPSTLMITSEFLFVLSFFTRSKLNYDEEEFTSINDYGFGLALPIQNSTCRK
ncbi:hypothetical protein Ciccas_005945 [Cichlidogyrus casuarinus]|uniref:Uncharacterized protein n=1 Tax=Cichlidogyrus casuarinus TaxID=1844966 RepID=A0ABD2QAY3_9PLAT